MHCCFRNLQFFFLQTIQENYWNHPLIMYNYQFCGSNSVTLLCSCKSSLISSGYHSAIDYSPDPPPLCPCVQCALWQWGTAWNVSRPSLRPVLMVPLPAPYSEHPSLQRLRQVTRILSSDYCTVCWMQSFGSGQLQSVSLANTSRPLSN